MLPEILTRAGRLPAVQPEDGDPLGVRTHLRRPTRSPSGRRAWPNARRARPHRKRLPSGRRSAVSIGGTRVRAARRRHRVDGGIGRWHRRSRGGQGSRRDRDRAGSRRGVCAEHAAQRKGVRARGSRPARSRNLGADRRTDARTNDTKPPATALTSYRSSPTCAEPRIALHESDRPGKVSIFTCPECHGTLWEADERGIVRFRCRVGHAYSAESMLAAQTDSVDRALWTALRSVEERAALTHRLAERARRRGHHWVARAFEERARAADGHAAVIRELLVTRATLHEVPDSEVETPEDAAQMSEE